MSWLGYNGANEKGPIPGGWEERGWNWLGNAWNGQTLLLGIQWTLTLQKQLPAEGTGTTYTNSGTFHLTASEPLALAQASHQVLFEMR